MFGVMLSARSDGIMSNALPTCTDGRRLERTLINRQEGVRVRGLHHEPAKGPIGQILSSNDGRVDELRHVQGLRRLHAPVLRSGNPEQLRVGYEQDVFCMKRGRRWRNG